ncbi:InlB B-repeat-containing protein [Bifidobacterium panos]|nr:InlB B-repeat-containing protein [Bifidobacterium sp. DSM 109963]
MRALAGVRWLAAALAALLVLAVAVPSAWADDDKPVVTLNEDQKTLVSIGDATTGASYKLDKATVSGVSSSYIVVQVDSGYFTPSLKAPAGATPVDALNDSGAYVAGSKVVAGGKYSYITFKSSDGNASITPANLQTYLQGLTFTTSGDTKQNVTVNAVVETLKAKNLDGSDTSYNVTLYDGHAYTFVPTVEDWDEAYADAKSLAVLGAKGHLLTIESAEEHNLIYKSFNNKPGWIGATRFTSAAHAGDDPDAFDISNNGDEDWGMAWYWVTGSSKGTMIWDGRNRQTGKATAAYNNFASGEPSGPGLVVTSEGCGQYGYGTAGQWNDILNTNHSASYNQGFYVEFEGFDLEEAGTTASAAVQRVNVSYDLDDNKVTSTTTDTKVLANNADYSTTLAAAADRTLDASSVKVTVGGNELAAADYTFESSTGLLKIPADKVTGDVVVSAKVMRQVTFDVGDGGKMKDATAPLSLSVAYGAKVSSGKSSSGASFVQPDVTANEGKRFTGWLASVDGVEDQMRQPSGVGDVEVTSDMTFTAQYKDLVTVTFKYDGGKDKNGKDSVSMSGVKDEEYDIPQEADLSRDGYTFKQWDSEPSGTYGDSDETFTAQWDANTNTAYKVEHYLQNVDDDKYPATPDATDSKTGTTDTKTAAEAKTTYTGFTAKSFDQENIAGDGKTVVKIYYTRDKHDVTFNAKGHGTTPDKQESVKYGAKVANPGDLSEDGYTFGGWYEDQACTDKKWDFAKNTMPAENLTLYAKWTANTNTAYKVEHYLQNVDDDLYPAKPDATDPMTGTTDQDTAAAAKTTYTGFTAGTVTQQKIRGDGTTVVKIYYERDKHDVTFNAKGHGTTPDKQESVKYGAKVTNPGDLSEDGYTFGGWYTDESFAGNTKWDFTKSTMPANDLTLYAKWTANTDTKYTVEHYLQNVDDDLYPATPKDVVPMTGTTDTKTAAKANEYEGFTPVDFAQENIAGDGKTVVKIYYTRDKHNVTFDAKGHGTTPDKQESVKYGAKVANPGDLSEDGYTFGGWYTDASFADEKKWDFSKSTMPANDLTLYAKWTANTDTKYTVEHYLQNVDDDLYPATPKDVVPMTGTTDTKTAAKANEYEGFTPVDFAQENISGDGKTVVEIYYTRDKHNVTFDAKGHGTTPDKQESVKYGAKVANPGDLSVDGYTFGGWYEDQACTDKKWDFDASTMPANNLTLYAKWTANTDTKYTVEHYLQNVDDDEYTLQSGDTETKQGTTDTETKAEAKTTYTGFTAKEFSQENIAGDGTTVVKIYYERDKHDVTFDAKGHGTTPDKQEAVKYGAKVANPGDLSQAGYAFGGWYTDASFADGTKWDFDASTMPANDLTLFAKWTANTDTAYTVEHYLQNVDNDEYTLQSGDTETKQGTTDTKTAAEAKSYTGFTPVDFAQGNIAGDGTTVVKIYYERDKHDVTFDAKGHGTTPDKLTGVKYGAKVTNPGALSQAGYAFGGWYTDASFADGTKWDFDASTMPAEDVTLYAKWTANEYGITYDPNDGTLPEDAPKTHTYGQETKLPTPTKDGYTFDGWYDEAGNKVDTVPADAQDMKITAKWKGNEYNITYGPNDGTLPEDAPKTHTYGQETKLPTPTKDGYTFDGWYDENGNKLDTIPANAQDLKITAKWTADEYDITYDPNDGTLPEGAPRTHTYGEETELPTPTRDGYTFDGWYDENGTKVDTIPANGKDLKITAKWTGNEYDITYDLDGGTLPADAPKTHTYGEETKLPIPTKDGYTFDGWYDEDGNKVDTIPANGKDLKITAKWKGDEYDITYDLDGGTLPADAPKTHTYGEETKLPTPTRDGYTFDGWYDEAGNKLDTIPADAQDMKITAKWTKNADNGGNNTDATGDNGGTKYDPNGGSMPEGWTGADGKLPVPTREGYKFDGWYDDEGNLVTSLKDAAGKTLHARWTKLNTLASTGATGLAAGLTALALAAAGLTVGILRRKRSR